MTTVEKQKAIFEDIQQYAFILQRDRYRTFDKDEIESEMMNWAAFRLETLWEMKQKNEKSYRQYLKVASLNLLNRMIIPIQVHHTMTTSFFEGKDYNSNVLTLVDAEKRLKRKDPAIFSALKELVSSNRFDILTAFYLEGKSVQEIAKSRKTSSTNVYNHIKTAIHLLVIKHDG